MKKTDEEFWEGNWKKSTLWRYRGIIRYMAIHRRFNGLFKSFLERGDKKVLEIGCARGTWLVYFAKEFGYEPYGVDYSKIGCKMAEENLKRVGIDGTILCEDIFKTSLKKEYFDVVYSIGLIEHFDDPNKIINKHIELLKVGGTLIITIPNFGDSLYLTLRKLLGKEKELLETHNTTIMDKGRLKEVLQGKGVQILMLDYFGPINLILAFEPKNTAMLLLMHLINQALGYITFYLKSKYFSSNIVLIAKKM